MDIYDIHSPRRSRRVKKATTFFGCVNKEKPKSVKSSQVTKGQSPVSTPAKSSTPSVHAQASRSSILYPTRTAGNGISAPLKFKNLTKKRQEWISDFKTKVAFTPAEFGIKSFKESRFLTLLTEELQTKIPDLTIEDVRHWAKLHSWITDEMQFKSLQKVDVSTGRVHSPNPDEINNSTPGYDADSTGNSYPIIQNRNLAEVMADSMIEEDEDGEHFESANNSDTNDTTNNVYQTIDDMINTNTYTTADDTFLNQRSDTFKQSSQGSFLTPPYVDVWMSRGMEYQRVCRFGSILEINQLASGALHHSTTAELSPTLISFAGQLTVSAEAEMDNFIVPERSPRMPLNFKMEGR